MITLFDNYDSYKYFDEYKQSIADANDMDVNDVPDDWVYDAMSDDETETWDECKSLLRSAFMGRAVIACGTAELWYRRGEAYGMYGDIDEAIEHITKDCDYVKIWQEKGHTFIRASHHDGTHEFELKVVTDNGDRYWDNWRFEQDPRTLHYSESLVLSNIWESSKYSVLPRRLD